MTQQPSEPGILFVYNADSGLWNATLDTFHKIASPSTYACRLCEVSYGLFGMRKAWAETIGRLKLPVRFLHRDEFAAAFPGAEVPLPAILVERDGALDSLVSAADFATIETLEALQSLFAARLAEAGLC
ncbi:MAG: hypothetical protein ACK4TG_00295 [Thermaurantiacus sp.]